MRTGDRLKTFFKLRNHKSKAVICRVSDLINNNFNPDALIDEFIRIDREVWLKITQDSNFLKTRDIVKSHFNICPQITYCAFVEGEMVATLTNMFTTDNDLRKNKTWTEKTCNGFLTTHIPNGDVGFGVDLAVTRKAPQKVSDRLVLTAIFVSV